MPIWWHRTFFSCRLHSALALGTLELLPKLREETLPESALRRRVGKGLADPPRLARPLSAYKGSHNLGPGEINRKTFCEILFTETSLFQRFKRHR